MRECARERRSNGGVRPAFVIRMCSRVQNPKAPLGASQPRRSKDEHLSQSKFVEGWSSGPICHAGSTDGSDPGSRGKLIRRPGATAHHFLLHKAVVNRDWQASPPPTAPYVPDSQIARHVEEVAANIGSKESRLTRSLRPEAGTLDCAAHIGYPTQPETNTLAYFRSRTNPRSLQCLPHGA